MPALTRRSAPVPAGPAAAPARAPDLASPASPARPAVAPTRAARRRMLLLGALPLLLVVAGGAWATGVSLGATVPFTYAQSLPAPAAGVSVDAAAGGVEVSPSPDDRVHLLARGSWRSARPSVRPRTDASGRLLVDTRCPGPLDLCDLQLEVQVPPDTTLAVETRGGPLTVTGLGGVLHLTTRDGPIEATNLTSATVTAESRGGPVSLAFHQPPSALTVSTRSGPVNIALPGALSYAVSTSGFGVPVSVVVPQDSTSPRRVSVQTRTGTVNVFPNAG